MRPYLLDHRLTGAIAVFVGLTHFALTTLVLRTVLTGQGSADGPGAWVAAAFAVLAFPLFYTPFRPTLGGLIPAGWLVAALNALFWAAAIVAVVTLWRRRRA